MPARQAWVAEYEQGSTSYAACRFIDAAGSGFQDSRLRRIVELHDRESRALVQGLPLA